MKHLLIILTLLAAMLSRATDFFPASVNYIDVLTAVSSASNGDFIYLPEGKATWTRQLIVSKALTFKGVSVPKTVITNGTNGPLILIKLVQGMRTKISDVGIIGNNISVTNNPAGSSLVLGF